jgi:hypothetical protein
MGGWVVNATPRPLYPQERPSTFVQEVGWAPEQVWTGAENLVPTGFRTPDRPARSESLYRLSYPGQHIGNLRKLKLSTLRNYHFPIVHPSDLSSLQVSPPKPILFPILPPPILATGTSCYLVFCATAPRRQPRPPYC